MWWVIWFEEGDMEGGVNLVVGRELKAIGYRIYLVCDWERTNTFWT